MSSFEIPSSASDAGTSDKRPLPKVSQDYYAGFRGLFAPNTLKTLLSRSDWNDVKKKWRVPPGDVRGLVLGSSTPDNMESIARFLNKLGKDVPGNEVQILDAAHIARSSHESRLQFGPPQSETNFSIVDGDMRSLPKIIADHSVNIIFCDHTLNFHLTTTRQDVLDTFEEMRRVISNDGICILGVLGYADEASVSNSRPPEQMLRTREYITTATYAGFDVTILDEKIAEKDVVLSATSPLRPRLVSTLMLLTPRLSSTNESA